MSINHSELLKVFLQECPQYLADVENNILIFFARIDDLNHHQLDKNTFQIIHAIKGGAGLLGLTKIQGISHAMENVLLEIHYQNLTPTTEILSILLAILDRLQEMISEIALSNDFIINDLTVLCDFLTRKASLGKFSKNVSMQGLNRSKAHGDSYTSTQAEHCFFDT